MRKISMISLIFFVVGFFETLRVADSREMKSKPTHESMIEVYGVPKSSDGDLSFGDNPVIESSENVKRNVKTSSRRKNGGAVVSKLFSQERREPSIQAYGLPKRVSELENNGHIERVNFERMSGLDGKVDKVNVNDNRETAGIQAYGIPKRMQSNDGIIEMMEDSSSSSSSSSSAGKIDVPPPTRPKSSSNVRALRSVDHVDDRDDKNDLLDLEAQEAKVFRPLFVYRQQVADRYRIKPIKNPIYGAYQYGNNRQRNSINYKSNKYYH